jgi:hypothetical protein
LRTPRSPAMASSDVASKPRVPKDDKAASSTRPLVGDRVSLAAIYQMVDNGVVDAADRETG